MLFLQHKVLSFFSELETNLRKDLLIVGFCGGEDLNFDYVFSICYLVLEIRTIEHP